MIDLLCCSSSRHDRFVVLFQPSPAYNSPERRRDFFQEWNGVSFLSALPHLVVSSDALGSLGLNACGGSSGFAALGFIVVAAHL